MNSSGNVSRPGQLIFIFGFDDIIVSLCNVKLGATRTFPSMRSANEDILQVLFSAKSYAESGQLGRMKAKAVLPVSRDPQSMLLLLTGIISRSIRLGLIGFF